MSLLLDALKKAAIEKEKQNSMEGDVYESPDVGYDNSKDSMGSDESNEPEVMDLDLDIFEKDEALSDEDNTDEHQIKKTITGLNSDEDLIIEGEAQEDNVETGEVEIEGPGQGDVSSDDERRNKELKDSFIKEDNDKDEAPIITPKVKNDYGVNNKEALSELINKSNKYSRRKNFKSKVAILIILIGVFIATAAYLYFEFSSDSQNIYIVNEESNRPTKNLEIKSKLIVKEKIADVSDQKSIKSEIKAQENSAKKIEKKVENISKKSVPKRIQSSIKNERIKIKHQSKKDPTEVLVRNAYAAFKNQNYKVSESLYSKAIKKDPRNRDAILGLAAIAVEQQRYEYARQRYQQLRYLNPKDSVAIAGLSSIQGKLNSDMNESELKFMLREQPEAAHLYFALGSVYAGQKKWADAQSSFFSAWSADNTNADYAYNLAVSLDQLGKKTQAKQLYESSLKLNMKNKGSFSVKIVEDRIKTLYEYNK